MLMLVFYSRNSDKPIEEPSHEKKTAEEKEINSNEHEDKKVKFEFYRIKCLRKKEYHHFPFEQVDAAPETTNDQQIASSKHRVVIVFC